jgi:phospholipase/carboxylesterase
MLPARCAAKIMLWPGAASQADQTLDRRARRQHHLLARPQRSAPAMPLHAKSYLDTRRAGPRPRTTPTNPHTQLDQNAPAALQERVFEIGRSLAGVAVGPSLVSVPGARAFHLPGCGHVAHGAFMIQCEFAHLHPPTDGSLHMTLPPEIVEKVIDNGWGERHPLAGRHGLPANIVMVYGPRDEEEFAVVGDLVRASHAFAAAERR